MLTCPGPQQITLCSLGACPAHCCLSCLGLHEDFICSPSCLEPASVLKDLPFTPFLRLPWQDPGGKKFPGLSLIPVPPRVCSQVLRGLICPVEVCLFHA